MAFGSTERGDEPYVELEIPEISHLWEEIFQQWQEILLVDVAPHVLVHSVVDVADRHGVAN
jgi:hypothetical protein